jgi:mono/diheme cytochrome c family protein
MRPMVRNAGEALGVSAELNLLDPSKGFYKSSAQIDRLYDIEQLIKGDPPSADKGFTGMKSPKWPDVLPPIKTDLAGQGEKLYKEICQGCHRPPVTSREFFETPEYWTKNENGEPVLIMENIPISHVGTDPAQALDMLNRTVEIPSNLGIKSNGFGPALGELVEKTVDAWYDIPKQPKQAPYSPYKTTSPEDRAKMNGYMPNGIRAELAYKVRSLNGIWATPPYLHNGSVPTIEALLGPADKRPTTVYLGNREYDPDNLGYRNEEIKNGFTLDTTLRGNSNRGHEFTNDEKAYGRVGRALLEGERKALIEFLKTL